MVESSKMSDHISHEIEFNNMKIIEIFDDFNTVICEFKHLQISISCQSFDFADAIMR